MILMKRLFDIILSAIAVAILWPLILLIAISILIIDGKPIFFRQWRVGMGGEEFCIIKFRTMSDSNRSKRGSFDAGSSSRVTGVGKLLRRTKLDEVPQLFNVLKGDMSVVGPRPEVRTWVDAYPDQWAYIHTVRPGITDPASILYRNEEDLLAAADDSVKYYKDVVLPSKINLYTRYVKEHTFFGDIIIIFKTIKAVLS